MLGMFAAAFAEFCQLNFIRCVKFVFFGNVILGFAFTANKCK